MSAPSSETEGHRPIVALSGGVGAARFLSGLVQVVPPQDVVALVNTGDDREFYGVYVAPDLDIVTYTLAGLVNSKLGYGLQGDRFTIVDALEKLGHEAWFRLGDRDFAHCLHRTLRMKAGAGLAEIADELRQTLGVVPRILPMSEDPCPTRVELADGRTMHFEDYMIREGAPDAVRSVDLGPARAAAPGPGVIDAIAAARIIMVCPSNPVVSIGPILAVPGIAEAIAQSAAPVVAVSPIVGGAPVKGPASQLLRGIGVEVSALGVARHYRPWIDGYVFDQRDAAMESDVRNLGLLTRVTDSMMVNPDAAARLAAATVELAESRA